MKSLSPLLLAALSFLLHAPGARAQGNLIVNGDFTDATNPFKGWRIDFPYEQPYAKNAGYLKISPDRKEGSAHAAEVTLPKAVAENEGGKIESAFIKAEPGATYHGSVDCLTGDFSAKIYLEAYALDPTPPGAPDKFRVPARDGLPALVMVYRAQFPDPPGLSATWTTVRRDAKIPALVVVAGKPSPPVFVALKVFVFSGMTATVPTGRADFTRFVLTATKP